MGTPHRVIREKNCHISGTGSGFLDTSILMGEMMNYLTSLDAPLMVSITDGVSSSILDFKTFMSKDWPCNNGIVTFGLDKLVLDHLFLRASYEKRMSNEGSLPYLENVHTSSEDQLTQKLEGTQINK